MLSLSVQKIAVLDLPCFTQRVKLDSTSIIFDDEDDSVGILKISGCSLQPKDEPVTLLTAPLEPPASESPILVYQALLGNEHPARTIVQTPAFLLDSAPNLIQLSGNDGLCRSSVIYPTPLAATQESTEAATTAQLQLREIMLSIQHLQPENLKIAFINLYLSDLSLFEAVNSEYTKWIKFEESPSRSCIQTALPVGVFVALQFVAVKAKPKEVIKHKAPQEGNKIRHCIVIIRFFVMGDINLLLNVFLFVDFTC